MNINLLLGLLKSDWTLCLSVRSEVAILYNDRSVLENHHVSAAYRLMAEEDMNILVNLNKDDWRCIHTHTLHIIVEPITVYFKDDRSLMTLIVRIDYWQGAEGSGHRDGDVHRHVVSLPADQDHEECPDTDTQVSAASMTSDLNIHTSGFFFLATQ